MLLVIALPNYIINLEGDFANSKTKGNWMSREPSEAEWQSVKMNKVTNHKLNLKHFGF